MDNDSALMQAPTITPDHKHGLLADCRLMLRYARGNAISTPTEVMATIAALDRALIAMEQKPIADLEAGIVEWLRTATRPPDSDSDLTRIAVESSNDGETVRKWLHLEEAILQIHEELSRSIAPTTALTLRVSEPAPGKYRAFGGMPLMIKGAATLSLGFAVLFVITTAVMQKQASQSAQAAIGGNQGGTQQALTAQAKLIGSK